MGFNGSKLRCRCDPVLQTQSQTQPVTHQTSSLLIAEIERLTLQQPLHASELAKEEKASLDEGDHGADEGDSETAAAEFSLCRLPYQCLRLIAAQLSSDDLLSLCQTGPDNCRIFGAGVFWQGRSAAVDAGSGSGGGTGNGGGGAFACLNAALERKLCLPIESLNGTYLPSLEDAESYSGRVVYLHDLNCRGGGVGDVVSDVGGGGGGGRLCIHDVVSCVPCGTYQVSLRAKLGPNWRLKGVTEVLLIPAAADPSGGGGGPAPLRARIPERRWCDLAFRHGYEHWFSVNLGRLCLPQSCSVQVQIVNAKVSKTQLKEGVYLDHIELAPLQCPLAEFTGYRRAAVNRRSSCNRGRRCRRRLGDATTVCQLL